MPIELDEPELPEPIEPLLPLEPLPMSLEDEPDEPVPPIELPELELPGELLVLPELLGGVLLGVLLLPVLPVLPDEPPLWARAGATAASRPARPTPAIVPHP